MPMYDVACADGHQTEVLTKIADRSPACRVCGQPTTRIWTRTSAGVRGDALDYVDENLGPEPIHITSHTQRRALMKARGLRECIRHVDGDQQTTRWI